MKTSKLLIALSILCLALGACATTDDNEPMTSAANDNPTEIPSATERQDDIAYTDISSNAGVPKVMDVTSTELRADSTVTYPTDPTVSSSATITTVDTTNISSSLNNGIMTSSPSSSTTTTTQSMTSSSTLDDTTDDTTDQEDTTTSSRTRLRKD